MQNVKQTNLPDFLRACRSSSRLPAALKLALLLIITGLHFSCPLTVLAQENQPSSTIQKLQAQLIQTIEQVEPAIVAVAVFQPTSESSWPIDADPFDAIFNSESAKLLPARFGAGVIIEVAPEAETASVLTCAHLLEPLLQKEDSLWEPLVSVRLKGLQTCRARILALDPRSDLAILHVDLSQVSEPAFVKAVQLGQAEKLQNGSLVLACGNPWGLARDGSGNVSLGMISNRGRFPVMTEEDHTEDPSLASMGMLIQVDVRTEPGLSGGALLDLDGKLVGIISSLGQEYGPENSAVFALPCTPGVRRIIEELRNGYEVEYGFLGIQPETVEADSLKSLNFLSGRKSVAQIGRVAKESPADQAGLLPDDLVLQVNDVPIQSGQDLTRETALLGPGAQAVLQVYRPATQSRSEVTAQLGKWPLPDESEIVATADRYPDWRGLRVDYPTARRRHLRSTFLSKSTRGVLITEVIPDSPAEKAGLKVGEFIAKVGEQPIETPAEFQQALEYWPGTVPITTLDEREVIVSEE